MFIHNVNVCSSRFRVLSMSLASVSPDPAMLSPGDLAPAQKWKEIRKGGTKRVQRTDDRSNLWYLPTSVTDEVTDKVSLLSLRAIIALLPPPCESNPGTCQVELSPRSPLTQPPSQFKRGPPESDSCEACSAHDNKKIKQADSGETKSENMVQQPKPEPDADTPTASEEETVCWGGSDAGAESDHGAPGGQEEGPPSSCPPILPAKPQHSGSSTCQPRLNSGQGIVPPHPASAHIETTKRSQSESVPLEDDILHARYVRLVCASTRPGSRIGVRIDTMINEMVHRRGSYPVRHAVNRNAKITEIVNPILTQFWKQWEPHHAALYDRLARKCDNRGWKLLQVETGDCDRQNSVNWQSPVTTMKNASRTEVDESVVRSDIDRAVKYHYGEFRTWASGETDRWAECGVHTQALLRECSHHERISVAATVRKRKEEWLLGNHDDAFKDCFNSRLQVFRSIEESRSDSKHVLRTNERCKPDTNKALSTLAVMDAKGNDVYVRADRAVSLPEVLVTFGGEAGFTKLYRNWLSGNIVVAARIDKLAGDRELIA